MDLDRRTPHTPSSSPLPSPARGGAHRTRAPLALPSIAGRTGPAFHRAFPMSTTGQCSCPDLVGGGGGDGPVAADQPRRGQDRGEDEEGDVEKAQRPAGTGTEKASDARALVQEKGTAERRSRKRRRSGTSMGEVESARLCVFYFSSF